MTEEERKYQEGMRSPKNRFLGFFCHANEVGDSWGLNWPFSCGVIIFSIIVGISCASDVLKILKGNAFTSEESAGIFRFMFVLRIFSDLIALVAIGFGFHCVFTVSYRSSIISYYVLVLSLLLNTIFLIYCLFKIFTKAFWNIIGFSIFVWAFEEFILFLFTWVLFCNMVHTGKKVKQEAQNNLIA